MKKSVDVGKSKKLAAKLFSFFVFFLSLVTLVFIAGYYLVDLNDSIFNPDAAQINWKLKLSESYGEFTRRLKFGFGLMVFFWGYKILGITSIVLWKYIAIILTLISFLCLILVSKKYGKKTAWLYAVMVLGLLILEKQINYMLKWEVITYPLSFSAGVYFLYFMNKFDSKGKVSFFDYFSIAISLLIDIRVAIIWGAWGLAYIFSSFREKVTFGGDYRKIFVVFKIGIFQLLLLILFEYLSVISFLSKRFDYVSSKYLSENIDFLAWINFVFNHFMRSFHPEKFSFSSWESIGIRYFFFFSFLGIVLKIFIDFFRKRKVRIEQMTVLFLSLFIFIFIAFRLYPIGSFRYYLFLIPLIVYSTSTFLSDLRFGFVLLPFCFLFIIYESSLYIVKKYPQNKKNTELLTIVQKELASEKVILCDYWTANIVNAFRKKPSSEAFSRSFIVSDKPSKNDMPWAISKIKGKESFIFIATNTRFYGTYTKFKDYVEKQNYIIEDMIQVGYLHLVYYKKKKG